MAGYSIFISYAHEDEAFKNALVQHLGGLKRRGLIDPWTDRCIDGGEEWRADIRAALDGCHLALLLVSPAFIASDFIYTEELSQLLERREREGIRLVPIILRPCAWKHEKPIEALQARPQDGKPIVTFSDSDGSRDQAWLEIVDDIARWGNRRPSRQLFRLPKHPSIRCSRGSSRRSRLVVRQPCQLPLRLPLPQPSRPPSRRPRLPAVLCAPIQNRCSLMR